MDHGGGLPGMFACLPYWWALWPAWELRVSGALSSLWKADLGDSTDCLIKLMFSFLRVCDLVDVSTLIQIIQYLEIYNIKTIRGRSLVFVMCASLIA